MAIGRNERGHELGVDSPGIVLRSVSCQSGTVEIELEYAPRFEYALIFPLLRPIEGGILARGGADVLVLSSPVELHIEGSLARAHFTLEAGEQASFALQHRASWEQTPEVYTQAAITDYLHDTVVGWRTWSDLHQRYAGPWRDLVQHSGRVLQALMYRPTGAIVAAPTTSLPESVGGERNWDYRYTWVRDASLTLEALWVAACPDEANRFFAWMAAAAAARVRETDLQIMFGVGGEHDLTERSLPHLAGWRDSRPVRIGNGAWNQRQLDVYGELLSAARRLRDQLGTLDQATRDFRLPPGVQPHRAGERGLGDLPGRREGRAETRKAWRGYGRQRGGPRSKSMKAIAVIPGQAGSVHLAELPRPRLNEIPEGRGVLVRV